MCKITCSTRGDKPHGGRRNLRYGLGSVAVALALVAVIAPGATGEITAYSTFSEFEANAGGLLTEHFEDLLNRVETGPGAIEFKCFGIEYAGPDAFGVSDDIDESTGVGPVSGESYLRAEFTKSSDALRFQFANPVTEFAACVKDYELDELGALNYETSNGQSGTAALPESNGTVQFWGIVSGSPFSSITFAPTKDPNSNETWRDRVLFDDVAMSVSAVPEPTTFALLSLLGLLGMLLARRR